MHEQRSAKGTGASLDWVDVHATHIMTWNESCTENVIFPASLYDLAEYIEYYSWYCTRTHPTLLSGPMPSDTRSYPENRTRQIHVLVSSLLYSISRHVIPYPVLLLNCSPILQTQETSEMHIDRAEMLRRTTKVGSSRLKPGLWSRMVAAICSLGGCVLFSPPAYDTPDIDPSRHSRSRRSTSTLSVQPSDARVRRDMNIMDVVGPSTPHSDVRKMPEYNIQATLTPMCTQSEFDSQLTYPTPQWSDTQDIGYPYSGSMSFIELLQSHSQWQPQTDEAGGSECYPQSCVDQAPSQYILQTSRSAPDNSTEWYAQHHHTGSDYTFTRRQGPRKPQDRERDSPQTTSRQRTSCIGNVADVVITSGWSMYAYDSLHT
jgi:hypothetical protein